MVYPRALRYAAVTSAVVLVAHKCLSWYQSLRRRLDAQRKLQDFGLLKGHWLTEPKDFSVDWFRPWIGDGLVVSSGPKWSRNRRLLTPAFHFGILKPYVTVFSESAAVMVEKFKRMGKGSSESFEMFEHVSQMTFDSLVKCIFGFQGDCQTEGFRHPYLDSVHEISAIIAYRATCFPLYSDLLFGLSWSGYRFRQACNIAHRYSQNIIRERKRTKAASEHQSAGKTFKDFLDILLEARDESGVGLTDAEIQAEVDTFMFAGHDTTASGISWCLYNLARHPEYQAKCRDEVLQVLGDKQHFDIESVQNLPFLTMCLKESLRTHPPGTQIGRQTTQDLTCPDGRVIPAGTLIEIDIYGCHHNPAVWDDPEVYDPYRFTAENSEGRSPHAFIPFSAGPRNCIGQNFAMYEMKVVVGQILRSFELSEDPARKPVKIPMVVLRAKHGLFVRFTPIAQDS